MFDDLDEVLRQLLVRELPIKNGDVDIAFNKPNREWSGRLSRPTLNMYLYDLRENIKLRQHSMGASTISRTDALVTQRRNPLRVDLRYLITAWATEPEDEHRLLARVLLALFRSPELAVGSLPEAFRDQPAPITLQAAQMEDMQNPADFWGSMDNEWKPGIACVVTMALNPYQAFTGPLVSTAEIRLGQSRAPHTRTLDGAPEIIIGIGGMLRSAEPLRNPRLRILERALNAAVQDDGRFVIFGLDDGDYTLELTADGRPPSRHRISVPAKSYEIQL
ncbi:MAG: DUF4255 domain-containing protein [Chloroflexi bacterium]|nr:DUF4255 domain-containing protein [Chloroflexota bacterium]